MRDQYRVLWNERQQTLRRALSEKGDGSVVDLFLAQHAMVHTAAVYGGKWYSFEDEVLLDLPDEAACCIPAGMEHSIAWCLWHITRIEDMVINFLVAGDAQLFDSQGWAAKLHAAVRDTGNAMSGEQILSLSLSLDLSALRDYRAVVGQRTLEIVPTLGPKAFKRKTDPGRLRALLEDGSIDPQSGWLADYWGGLTVGGLLLMPPTRHPFVHHNEATAIKKRLLRR